MKNIVKYMIVCSLFNVGIYASQPNQHAGKKRKAVSVVDAQSDDRLLKKAKVAAVPPQVTVPVVPVQIHTVSFVPVDAQSVLTMMQQSNALLNQTVQEQQGLLSQLMATAQQQQETIIRMNASLQKAKQQIEKLEDERDKKLPHRYLSDEKIDREGISPSPTVFELMRQSVCPSPVVKK